jgi:flagellar biosynthetic protein FliO
MKITIPNALQRAALLLFLLYLVPGVKVYAQVTTASTPAVSNPSGQPTDYERLPFMENSELQVADNNPSPAGLLLRTLGALLLIVGLIILAGWGLRRFGAGMLGNGPGTLGPEVAVLSQTPLGNNRSLTVVKFGERVLLLGATAHSFTLLSSEPHFDLTTNPPVLSVAELLAQDGAPNFSDELARVQGLWPAKAAKKELA